MNLTTPMESIKASQSMNNSITYERKESMSIFKSFKMNVNNYNSRKLFNLSRTTMNPMVQKIRLDKRITLLEKISFSRGTISISMLIHINKRSTTPVKHYPSKVDLNIIKQHKTSNQNHQYFNIRT